MKRQDAIAAIRSGLKCTDYLEKSKGRQYICPKCGSGTGSNHTGALTYYPETNTFTCFSCEWSGDVIDLIQETTGSDFNTALKTAAAAMGITIDPYKPTETDINDFKSINDKLLIDNKNNAKNGENSPTEAKEAADYTAYYKECAARLKDPAAISYLTARGISVNTAAAFGVGYDPQADPAQSGYKLPRLILPTTAGHYIGRSIDPNTAKNYAKMNNKGGTPGIFGKAAIYTAGPVFVTEGAFDAMSLYEIGADAIALNSTSNGRKLIEQLQAEPAQTKFIICFDNDPNPKTNANTKAAAEGLKTDLARLNYDSIVFSIAGYLKPGEKDINDIMQRDKTQVAAIVEAATKELNRDYLADFFDKVQTEAYKPYTTGLTFFDNLLGGGVIRQTLLLLMAAPGTGKTTLCQQIAEEMAARQKPVIYFNLEMSREQMLAKAISSSLARKGKGPVTALQVLQGYNWTIDQKADIAAAMDEYRQSIYPYLKYNPNTGSDLDSILNYLRSVGDAAAAAGTEAPAVIVDYLHLISSKAGLDNPELIKQAVTGLKQYAIDYNTFVIAIVATNRVSNTAGKITMESGRDSSNIEYTADYQLSLNYFDIDNGTVKTDDLEGIARLQAEKWRRMIIRVLKGRFTPPGRSANVYFNAAQNIFFGTDGYIPEGAEPFTAAQPKIIKRR